MDILCQVEVESVDRVGNMKTVNTVVLREKGGTRRLEFVIGNAEANAIDCALRGLIPPRPLTHDLAASLIKALAAQLLKVEIRLMAGNIFAAQCILESVDGEEKILDARASDALGLALRLGAPIFVPSQMLGTDGPPQTSIKEWLDNVKTTFIPELDDADHMDALMLSRLDEATLKMLCADACSQERYELAAKLKSALEQKRLSQQPQADSPQNSQEEQND